MKHRISSVDELDQALAACRASEDTKNTIELAAGDYLLSAPITLDERDSGLTLAGSGSTTLCGGCRLSGWRREGDLFRVHVPSGAEPRLLIVDGVSRGRSRFPAEGMLENRNKPEDLRWMSSTGGGWNRPLTHDELTHMAVNPDDLPAGMDLTNAEITVYHKWDESTVRVKAYDAADGLVEFLTETGHPAGAFQTPGYTVWNTEEGLTQPGQWFFDRSVGQIVYLPLPGEDPDTLDAWIPLAGEHVILCERCQDIEIRDFSIRLCHAPAEAVGLRAINAPGAIEARDAESIRLVSLDISHVTGNGIKLMRCKNLNVDHCRVQEAGAGGIFTHECENEVITHNTIDGIGRTTFSAIGIHCGWKSMLVYVQDGYPEEKGTVLLAHNTIHDVPYCGITCNGGPHRIEYNRISRCMTVLHDGAAIYCSRGDRTIMLGNCVFDTDARLGLEKQCHAYYLDEQSRHCVLEANIAVNVASPIHFHMSEDILICRNVFLCDSDCSIRMTKSRYTTWRHNIVVCEGKLAFSHRGRATKLQDVFAFIHCLAYSRSGELELMPGNPRPPDNELLCTDPLLEIDDGGTISVRANSPVNDMEFTLPDGRFAGVDAPDPEPEMVRR